MNVNQHLLEHRGQLNARLETIEAEKAQLVRKLKAIDVLLEGTRTQPNPPTEHANNQSVVEAATTESVQQRKRSMAAHAVRYSQRISLIGAVQEVAMKQAGSFDSVELLAALKLAYPEFNLGETKHISSPLSDLVKKKVLIIERARSGSKPNIYRVAHTAQ